MNLKLGFELSTILVSDNDSNFRGSETHTYHILMAGLVERAKVRTLETTENSNSF